jgi:hypothetical protein
VVGDRVEVIDPQRKVLTVLSIAELERMKLEYQRGLDRMRKGVFDTSIVDLLVDYTDKVRATGSDNPAWNLLRDTILSMIGGIGGIVRSYFLKSSNQSLQPTRWPSRCPHLIL